MIRKKMNEIQLKTKKEVLELAENENWEYIGGIEIQSIPLDNLEVRKATEEECRYYGIEPQPGYVLILHPETEAHISMYFAPNSRTLRLLKWAQKMKTNSEAGASSRKEEVIP